MTQKQTVCGLEIETVTAASLYRDEPDFYCEWVVEDAPEFSPQELAHLALLFGLRS